MSDLYVATNGQVHIDGHRIDKVTELDINYDHGRPRVTIEFIPTSVVTGDLPDYMIEEVLFAHTPVMGGKIDMGRAMDAVRSKPFRQQTPNINEILGPPPVRRAEPLPKKAYAEAKEAPPEDAAVETCGLTIISSGPGKKNSVCYRPMNHHGACR